MSLLDKEPVKRVNQILKDFNPNFKVVVLETSARTAQEAASSLGCEVGAIVKSLLFKTANNFEAVTGFMVDVCSEAAPGLTVNPITVPMEILEVIDTGINLSGKTPENQVKKDPTTIKPSQVEENEMAPQAFKDETKLPDKNTTLPGAQGAKTAQYTTKYMEG